MATARSRAAWNAPIEGLEARTFLNAAPVAPGFPVDDPFPGLGNGPWPRLNHAAIYDGQVPTIDITYDEMLALSQASDPDGDTVYFLCFGGTHPALLPNGFDAQIPFGLVDGAGQFLPPRTGVGDMSVFDPNNDGVPNGDYVLEPGETWHWRGPGNAPFTGRDLGPPSGGAGDFGLLVRVTDTIRDENTIPVSYISVSGNRAMSYHRTDSSDPLGTFELGHTGSFTLSYDQLLAAITSRGTIIDPENATPKLVIYVGNDDYGERWATQSGTLTVGGVDIGQYLSTNFPGVQYFPDRLLTPDLPFVLTQGESVTFTNTRSFDGTVFGVSLWDGLSGTASALSVHAKSSTNALPTADLTVDLGSLSTARHGSWTYNDLLALAHVSDADGDPITITLSNLLDVGELRVNGQKLTRTTLINPGDTIGFTAAGLSTGRTGFVLQFSDTWGTTSTTFSYSAADFDTGGVVGDTALASGARIVSATAIFPFSTHLAAWRNAAGQLIVSFEDLQSSSGAAPTRFTRNLSTELGLPALTGDPVVAGNMGVEIYLPTAQGLLSIGLESRHDSGDWDPMAPVWLRNLSAINTLAPVSELAILSPPAGILNDSAGLLFYGVAGRAANGDMVLMWEADPLYLPGDDVFVFNVTAAVESRGLTMPELPNGFVAYAQSWGGYNIVGLDGAGAVIGIWTGEFYLPGNSGYNNIDESEWNVSNLSEITGAPRLVGSLSVFSTGWNAINIVGTSEAGHAVASWWAPQLGAGNWQFVDFTQQFNGVPLGGDSLTGWVTSWGALNVAGVDQNGQVQVYWWVPGNITEQNPAGWKFEALASPTFSAGTRLSADSTSFHATNVGQFFTRMSIYGADDNGRVGFTYWEPSLGTQWAQAWA